MTRYDPHDWRSHLFDIRGSLVREIALRVTTCVLWSAVVVAFDRYAAHFGTSVQISMVPHTLIGGTLSLLLVFRTNASYDRFWEGRKLWGSIVNESRNLARTASVLILSDATLLTETLRWVIAFPWSAARSLQGRPTEVHHLAGLPTDEVDEVISSRQSWLQVARAITRRLAVARRRELISDVEFSYVDQNVQTLVDCMGGCQRIHNTPMPFAYMVHLRRALIVYAFSLPFALVESFGWWTVLLTLLISYTLFGIEEIGVEIEDPFGDDENDLKLNDICTTIEGDLREYLPTDTEKR